MQINIFVYSLIFTTTTSTYDRMQPGLMWWPLKEKSHPVTVNPIFCLIMYCFDFGVFFFTCFSLSSSIRLTLFISLNYIQKKGATCCFISGGFCYYKHVNHAAWWRRTLCHILFVSQDQNVTTTSKSPNLLPACLMVRSGPLDHQISCILLSRLQLTIIFIANYSISCLFCKMGNMAISVSQSSRRRP